MAEMHLLRPGWLWLLLLVPVVIWLWRRGRQGGSGWERLIPNPLLSPLMPASGGRGVTRGRGWWAALLIIIATIALAGPSWRKAPNPLEKLPNSLVVALDLSLSMLATDESPNRLTRAKQKIRDLIPERADAFTGLVAYAGDAHVVTPLTDDPRAIENLLPALDPFIMPALGSRADRAVATAIDLLQQGGRGTGTVLLVTDSIDSRYHDDIQSMLGESGYQLRILAVGTPVGAPIPIPERGFLRDQGELVTPQLDMQELGELASLTGGSVARITLTNDDLNALAVTETLTGADNTRGIERELNLWVDDGYWLLWLLLPLALLAWRRGGLTVVLLAFTLPLPQTAEAMEWDDLWLRGDQQGAELFGADPEAAAEAFTNPAWKGSALYRAGDYEAAAEAFSGAGGPDAHYNRGNALARQGDLEGAIAAYDAALALQPNHADAKNNQKLVEALLKQKQKQEQQQKQKDQQNQGKKSDQQQQQDQDGQSQDSSGQSGKSQDSGEGGKQPADQSQPQQGDAGTNGEKTEEELTSEAEGDQNQGDQNPQQGQTEQGLLGDQEAQSQSTREQWIRRVPDDPAGLLRRKFLYQYQQKNLTSEDTEPW